MGEQEAEGQTEFNFYAPPEVESGVYSNMLGVWHTAYEFTLDFAATQPPQPNDPNDPSAGSTVPCRIVTRVKIPPTIVFNVIQALNENMTQYEERFGEIQRPGEEEQ
jgi:hypothetical protein